MSYTELLSDIRREHLQMLQTWGLIVLNSILNKYVFMYNIFFLRYV